MSLVQVRQKESSFRREETVRTSVRERTNERTKERRNKGEKREQKKRMIPRWSNRQRERLFKNVLVL